MQGQTGQLVIVRHGQSLWNLENRFTGWVDVPLTDTGREEARHCAHLLRESHFDVAYASTLCRATESLTIILGALDQQPPVIRDPALNERHYGDLQGLDKREVAKRFGADQVMRWRRSYHEAPPGGESLEMVARRTLPFFERSIVGDLQRGKIVLVVAHGNSLRSIIMKLEALSPEQIATVELETGVPIEYQVTRDGAVLEKHVRRLGPVSG